MGKFKREDKRSGGGFGHGFGGARSFGGRDGGRSRFGGRDEGKREMYQAVCSECGDSCELPFRPSGDRPVFCSICFDKQQGNSGGRFSGLGGGREDRGERRERPRFGDKEMNSAICDQCGKSCQVPFRPTPGKPVYCDDCFGKGGNISGNKSGSKSSPEVLEQIKLLNVKVDKLIKLLTPNSGNEKPEIKKEVAVAEAVKIKKEKNKEKTAPKKVAGKKKK